MRKRLLGVALLVPVLAACGPNVDSAPTSTSRPTVSPTVSPTVVATQSPVITPLPVMPSHCQAKSVGSNVLPDPSCTPGVINPNVTQENIAVTICKKGWTGTVRPPQSYTGPLKVKSIAAYGYPNTKASAYEFDHLIALSLGGDPRNLANLWAEPAPVPNVKDGVESALNHGVCSHKITLQAAQQAIATDWTTARAKLGV